MRVPILMLSGPARSGKDAIAEFLVRNHRASAVAQADPMKRLAAKLFGFTESQLWGPSDMRNAVDPEAGARADVALRRWFNIAGEFLREVMPEDRDGATSLWHWFDGIRKEGVITPRRVLQTLGTEWGRQYDPSMWVSLALNTARRLLAGECAYHRAEGCIRSGDLSRADMVVITDGRFRNELLATREAGGSTVRVLSPGAGLTGDAAQHSSETESARIPDSWFDAVFVNRKEHGLGQLERAVRSLMHRLEEPVPYISTWAAEENAEKVA